MKGLCYPHHAINPLFVFSIHLFLHQLLIYKSAPTNPTNPATTPPAFTTKSLAPLFAVVLEEALAVDPLEVLATATAPLECVASAVLVAVAGPEYGEETAREIADEVEEV